MTYNRMKARDLNTGQMLWSKEWASGLDPREINIKLGREYGMWWEGHNSRVISCVDFRTGDIIWQGACKGEIRSFAVDPEQNVIIASYDEAALQAFDSRDGTELWSYKPHSSSRNGKKVYIRPQLFWGINRGQALLKVQVVLSSPPSSIAEYEYELYSFDTRTGEIMWRTQIAESSWLEAFVDETIYVAEIARYANESSAPHVVLANIRTFDASSGEEKWKLTLPTLVDYVGFQSPLTRSSYVVSYTNNPASPGWEIDNYRLVKYLHNNILYLLAFDNLKVTSPTLNHIFAISMDTGEPEWYFKTSGVIMTPLMWDDDGDLYFWTEGGRYEHSNSTAYHLHWLTSAE
jgi:outer membrane protein assembly factor BamB